MAAQAHQGHRTGAARPIRLVAYPAVDEAWIHQIQACAPDIEFVNAGSEAEACQAISKAAAFYGRLSPALWAAATNLAWVQAPGAAMEGYIFAELAQSDVTLTNMRGIYNDVIADHAFAFVLSFARNLHLYARNQQQRRWERYADALHLPGMTLGVIGLGGIGLEVAKRAGAFGMRAVAVDPRREEKPKAVAQLWRPHELERLLESSDFVVICAPLTPKTRGMIGLPQLRCMKESAYLINVGRGAIVNLEALNTALRQRLIAGAGLDVFEIEPLPEAHPLWDLENVIIVPHAGGAGAPTHDRRRAVLIDNLRRFVNGEPLQNVVDKQAWY